MATIELVAGNSTGASVLTTELNSLAAAAGCALSTAIANQTDLDIWGWFELNVTFGTGPTADSLVHVYVVPLNSDASNYGDYSTTGPITDPNTLFDSFIVRSATTAQRRVTKLGLLRARSFKVAVVNGTNQAFPASGSTLKLFTQNLQSS